MAPISRHVAQSSGSARTVANFVLFIDVFLLQRNPWPEHRDKPSQHVHIVCDDVGREERHLLDERSCPANSQLFQRHVR
eukprot:COSAG01_NODE_6173_length_3811_cov_4.771013_6_plen_79_part_00